MAEVIDGIEEFLAEERLPASYSEQVSAYFQPFISALEKPMRSGDLRVLGIHGAQGSGKSTLAGYFAWYLRRRGLSVAVVSLDDFYLRRAEREELAELVHPLFATRGVPGTHDVRLGVETLQQLLALRAGQSLPVPRFDKLADDRFAEEKWSRLQGPMDVVIFEGWCVGALPQSDDELVPPVNELERREDAEGRWRQRVNDMLAHEYQRWFAHIDYLLMLEAPGFACVAEWRLEQEQRLAARRGQAAAMDAEAVGRFVSYYQRLTEHSLRELPITADGVMRLDVDRNVVEMRTRQ